MKKIVSFGCGVDSVANIALMYDKGIIPDHIIFADTGGEKPKTYEYLNYFNGVLKSIGFPEVEVVSYETKEGVKLTLEQDCLNNKSLPSIVFGYKQCSEKFKIRPSNKYIKHTLKIETYENYVGFNFDEKRRVRENDNSKVFNRFLLIENEINRENCVKLIESMGWLVPPKSACFYCPSSKKDEIIKLPKELKDRAINMEKNATKVMEVKGLGRNYSWTDLIYMDETQFSLFDDLELTNKPCECTE